MKRALALALVLVCTSTVAYGDRVDETEPNDTNHPLAMRLAFGDVGHGALASGTDVDAFGMELPSPADGSGPFLFACVDASAGADTTLLYDFGIYGSEADDDDGPGGVPVLATPLMGGVFGVMDARIGEQGADAPVASYDYYSVVAYDQTTLAEIEPNDALTTANPHARDAVEGTIGTADDVDVYRFHASAGDRIVAILANDPDDDDATVDTLELLDSGGTVMASDGDADVDQGTVGRRESDAILFTAVATGMHYVRVRDTDGSVGEPYAVAVLVGGFAARPWASIESQTLDNDSLANATPLAPGSVGRGNLAPATDYDSFRLSGVAQGDSIFAVVIAGGCFPGGTPTTRDPWLEVYDANDQLLGQDDDGGAGSLPLIASSSSPVAGSVGFRIHEDGTNATVPTYSLVAAAIDPNAATTEDTDNEAVATADVIRSESVSGSLSASTDVDYFAFRVMAGEQMLAIVDEAPDGAANDTSTIVNFYLASGAIPTASNATPADPDLHTCPITAPETGTVYARVANFNAATDIGPYRMVVFVDGEPAATKHGFCGDGAVQSAFEACDDGNTVDDGNGCSAACTNVSTCGNGVRETAFETCDDGNTSSGDGCAADCSTVELGYACETPAGGLTTCTLVGEACTNGVDDDGDQAIDCADPDCALAPSCPPSDGGTGGNDAGTDGGGPNVQGSGGCGCRTVSTTDPTGLGLGGTLLVAGLVVVRRSRRRAIARG